MRYGGAVGGGVENNSVELSPFDNYIQTYVQSTVQFLVTEAQRFKSPFARGNCDVGKDACKQGENRQSFL